MENLKQTLIELEEKYGGYVEGIERRLVSPLDPRPQEKIKTGGMIGGDRMAEDKHNYSEIYSNGLAKKIEKGLPVVLVEFGVLCGSGLAMWADVLPPGSRIIGFDIDLSHFEDNRENLISAGAFQANNVEIYKLDQFVDNAAAIGGILENDRIDIVIDDGCHFDNAIIKTVLSVWPWLAPGFIYFIEDNSRIHKTLETYFNRNKVESLGAMTVISGRCFQEWIDKATGYQVNFQKPTTWNDKINWKKVYDRNPLIPITADKYLAREYVTTVLGSDEILKPMLIVTDPYVMKTSNKDNFLPWQDLPEKYVIKPNHLSGAVLFVDGEPDKELIFETCKRWLNQVYVPWSLEWSYLAIPPVILVEETLEGKPDNFKFNMIHGKCASIKTILGGKNKSERTITYYNQDWGKINVVLDGYPTTDVQEPPQLRAMVDYAEALSEPFDFCRIDFMVYQDRVYFEEVTHYPVGGHGTFEPLEYDCRLGDMWNIKRDYWK